MEIDIKSQYEIGYGFSLGDNTNVKDKQKKISVIIKNIGHGFAKSLVIHTGFNIGGIVFNKVINVGDSTYTYFVVNKDNIASELKFALQYIDSMTNE